MREKLKENKENRGLNNNKAYEDQFMYFDNFWVELPSILSFFHTLAHLEYSWNMLGALQYSLGFGEIWKGKQEITREYMDQQLKLDYFAGTEMHV